MEPTTAIPIACDLTAFTADERERHSAVSSQVAAIVEEVQNLPDGYAFRYRTDASTWMLVAEFAELEGRCCPFFNFTLERVAAGPVWLRLTGGPGVKEFIASEMNGA